MTANHDKPGPGSWTDFAICRGLGHELFFPPGQEDLSTLTEARRICVQCPVREPCVEYAIMNNESGIWGGTSERARKRIRRARMRGTRASYAPRKRRAS